MKFLSMYKTAERNAPPSVEHIETMQKLVEEGQKAGWLLSTEGCLPSARGARVRSDGGKVTITDGPFTESKELVAGFAILQAGSKEEAIEMTKRFLAVAGGDGECEIREVYSGPEAAPCTAAELVEQFANR